MDCPVFDVSRWVFHGKLEESEFSDQQHGGSVFIGYWRNHVWWINPRRTGGNFPSGHISYSGKNIDHGEYGGIHRIHIFGGDFL